MGLNKMTTEMYNIGMLTTVTKRMFKSLQKLSFVVIVVGLLITCSGCVYYNTFYNARSAFNEAEGQRKSSPYGKPRINSNLYGRAIEKSLKVVENYPNSKWYDDALYVLGVSYFYTKKYNKADRRFREILADYPDSKYITDCRLYLAKVKLEQREMVEATELFEELFQSDISQKLKAEAAMGLGKYYFDNRDFDKAQSYFYALRDSLGSEEDKKVAQRYIADGHFERLRYRDARKAYQEIIEMEPAQDEYYHAMFRSAICSYRMQKIEEGFEYLTTLLEDVRFFDSSSVIKMQIAEGYEYDESPEMAEDLYLEITNEEELKKKLVAEASYRLGLIYQFDYDSLNMAKEFYDKAVAAARSSEFGREALQLSSAIGKRETFARTAKIDSTSTQEMIDEAAYTQLQLAELYWVKLDKPDTAMIEMQYVIDSFPTAYDAPRAMIALSGMVREHNKDSLAADSILYEMLARYPGSDYTPSALEELGMLGSDMDTGYAELHIHRAEKYLGMEEIDSATTEYQYVVDNFPESNYYLQARFALIWLEENYKNSGDSTVFYEYTTFADSFPGTQWATLATNLTKYRPPTNQETVPGEPGLDDSTKATSIEDLAAADTTLVTGETDEGYIDPQAVLYIDPNGDRAIDLPSNVAVMEVLEPFEYPTEAYASGWQGDLFFQIKLDFDGTVSEYIQKIFAPVEEVNLRAEEAVRSSRFNTQAIPPEAVSLWYVYKFTVIMPSHLR